MLTAAKYPCGISALASEIQLYAASALHLGLSWLSFFDLSLFLNLNILLHSFKGLEFCKKRILSCLVASNIANQILFAQL